MLTVVTTPNLGHIIQSRFFWVSPQSSVDQWVCWEPRCSDAWNFGGPWDLCVFWLYHLLECLSSALGSLHLAAAEEKEYLEECTGLAAMPRSDYHSILTLLATSGQERLGSSIFLGVQEPCETGVMSIWQCVCHNLVVQSVN